MRGAAEVASVRTSQAAEHDPCPRGLFPKHLETVDDQGVAVRHPDLGFAQEAAHEAYSLLAADMVAVGIQHLIGRHCSVPAQHNLRLRRMFPDQSHNLLHAVVGSQNERYTHDLVPAPELADEFP